MGPEHGGLAGDPPPTDPLQLSDPVRLPGNRLCLPGDHRIPGFQLAAMSPGHHRHALAQLLP